MNKREQINQNNREKVSMKIAGLFLLTPLATCHIVKHVNSSIV